MLATRRCGVFLLVLAFLGSATLATAGVQVVGLEELSLVVGDATNPYHCPQRDCAMPEEKCNWFYAQTGRIYDNDPQYCLAEAGPKPGFACRTIEPKVGGWDGCQTTQGDDKECTDVPGTYWCYTWQGGSDWVLEEIVGEYCHMWVWVCQCPQEQDGEALSSCRDNEHGLPSSLP